LKIAVKLGQSQEALALQFAMYASFSPALKTGRFFAAFASQRFAVRSETAKLGAVNATNANEATVNVIIFRITVPPDRVSTINQMRPSRFRGHRLRASIGLSPEHSLELSMRSKHRKQLGRLETTGERGTFFGKQIARSELDHSELDHRQVATVSAPP
jgi:hypothetical protein